MVRLTAAIAAIMLSVALPASAQNNDQDGLVNVSLSNVANNLAQNLSVDVSQIPVTVQVPVGIAANVCGVAANVLAQQKKTGEACTATSTNDALTKIVQRQLPQ